MFYGKCKKCLSETVLYEVTELKSVPDNQLLQEKSSDLCDMYWFEIKAKN